jgi:hypothetical protein
MKALFITLLLTIGLIEISFTQGEPRIDPDGRSHFPNGTIYDPRTKVGKQGTVENKKKGTRVDCEEFQEICQELLEEAWDSLDPDQPDTPAEGGGTDGGTNDGGSSGGSGDTKDDGKDGGKKQSNALSADDQRWLDPEYRAQLKIKYGIWHRNSSGQWIFVEEPNVYMVKLLKRFQ